jgi:methyl-accepting chemotaxis protein
MRLRLNGPRRIGARLAAGFAGVLAVMVAMSVHGLWQMHRQQQRFVEAIDVRVQLLTQLQALSAEIGAVTLAARDALLQTEPEPAKAALDRIEAGRTRIGSLIEGLQAHNGPSGKPLAEELGTHSTSVLVALLKFSRQQRAQQADAAKTLLYGALQPKLQALAQATEQAVQHELQALQTGRNEAQAHAVVARRVTLALLAGALALAGLVAWAITRGITVPVGETIHLAEAIAAGDLSTDLRQTRDDEIGRLQQALLAMQQRLRELVAGIRTLADQLASASGEIADGSNDLSRRTETAAGSLQQTAASLEQLAQTVSQSVDTARAATEMVGNAAGTARRGGDTVDQVIARMGEISAASGQIAEITGVIDGIAFQTNILALNAAVEAARAGEHGKGFAVVASEVRALAQRAAQAAREIKSLIGASTEKVAAGERLVKDAGTTMREIVDGVARATAMVDEICRAAGSQSQGIGEVNASVAHLDDMTQKNAALVEQSAAAAEGLRDQAHSLQAMVQRFKLEA